MEGYLVGGVLPKQNGRVFVTVGERRTSDLAPETESGQRFKLSEVTGA